VLTLFASPKAFRGHVALIQRNAIRSWTHLDVASEILLFGNETGTAEVAAELGVRHVPELTCSPSGAPMLDGLFTQAERLAANPILCYVNADIILMGDFTRAVRRVSQLKGRFLLVGRRWDLDVLEELAFNDRWENRLLEQVASGGRRQIRDAIDYFVFSRGLWGDMPPFALGRGAWDDWLAYRARARRAMVIDATPSVKAVHQNHDYSHLPGNADEAFRGAETRRNLELAGGPDHLFSLDDATHILDSGRLHRALGRAHLRRRCEAASILYPAFGPIGRALLRLADSSYHLRRRLGLALNPGRRRDA